MIICIKCPKEVKEKLDILLQSGSYRDYGEIISVAVENLALISREMGEKGALILNLENSEQPQRPSQSPRTRSSRTRREPSSADLSSTASLISAAPPPALAIPGIFGLTGLEQPPPIFADPPADALPSGQDVPLDRWVFGQYNKLLPAKATCRALARLLTEHPEGVPLDLATGETASSAGDLGDYLHEHDRRHGIGRDDALATAFPRTGLEGEKGRARYSAQFVGSVDRRGRLSGLLADYRLAGLAQADSLRLALTRAGWEFACLTNPVLDIRQDSPTDRFSPEETAWLIDHIRRNVPVEDFAFQTVIAAIAGGADTPEALDAALARLAPRSQDRDFSSAFLTSQRSGAISRMADLGLIARVRKGVKVAYHITEDGDNFMARTSSKTRKENG